MPAAPRTTIPTQLVLRELLTDPTREVYGLELGRAAGLASGTVHPILARLETLGWVTSRWEDVDPRAASRPARRYYHLTDDGAQARATRARPGGAHRRRLPSRARARADLTRPVAVGQLPAAQRQRYAMESLAELHDLGRPAQLRHVLGLVAHAWDLRLALQDSSPRIEKSPAMRKSIRCILRMHHDVLRHNGEAQPPSRYYQCTRCGRVVDPPSMAHVGFLG